MEALQKAILTHGAAVGNDIVKVDMFLNHRIDTALVTQMGQAIADYFKADKPDLVLTVEASGISAALTTAQALGYLPLVFAKKGDHRNVSKDVYASDAFSFTHGRVHSLRVSRAYLKKGARVLIVDDFLANGAAISALWDIVLAAGATLVGAAVCVEKGFQPGGKMLREKGLKLLSLATIDALEGGKIVLK